MITFENKNEGVSLSLNVEGYQFPESNDDWCNVKLHLNTPAGEFLKVDPALESEELQDLLKWFEDLQFRQLPKFAHLCFTEPVISFEFLAIKADTVRVAIHLSHEFKPSCIVGGQIESKDYLFDLSKEDLIQITTNLRQILKKYPSREG